MDTEPALPVTFTHSGLEAKGTILGLEGQSIVPVLAAAVVSVLLVVLNMGAGTEGLAGRLAFALLPFALTTLYVVLMVHRKPPHYARDVGCTLRMRLLDALGLSSHEGGGFNTRPARHRPQWPTGT